MSDRVIQKSIPLASTPERVRHVLTDDTSIRQWCAPFCEGTYAVADWKEGGRIDRCVNGEVCAPGILEVYQPNVKILTHFFKDDGNKGITHELGEMYEKYTIHPGDGGVTLEIMAGPYSEEYWEKWASSLDSKRDEALAVIKRLSE